MNPARRRRRRRLATLVVVVLLIALGAWFSITVLFKINNYEVQGQGLPYSKEEIVGAFGHAVGDNLFGFSVQSAKERLESTLPYIEKADIRRMPPSTVQFRLTVAQEVYAVPWEGAFAILNGTGKVLRLAGEVPADIVRINGLTGLLVEPGHPITLNEAAAKAAASLRAGPSASTGGSEEDSSESASDSGLAGASYAAASAGSGVSGDESTAVGDASNSAAGDDSGTAGDGSADPGPEMLAAESFEVLWLLLDELEKSGLQGVTWLDVGDPLELAFGWENRITVKLGAQSGLAEKIAALGELLADPSAIGAQAKGTLDLSLFATTGRVFLAEE